MQKEITLLGAEDALSYTVTDENGQEFEIEIVAELEQNDRRYVLYAPANGGEEDEEVPLDVFAIVTEGGEESFAYIEDEDEYNAVCDAFAELAESEEN